MVADALAEFYPSICPDASAVILEVIESASSGTTNSVAHEESLTTRKSLRQKQSRF